MSNLEYTFKTVHTQNLERYSIVIVLYQLTEKKNRDRAESSFFKWSHGHPLDIFSMIFSKQ